MLYKASTRPLTSTFDMDLSNVKILMDELKTQSESYGWSNILSKLSTIEGDESLAGKHAQINEQEFKSLASQILAANDCRIQKNYQLCLFLKRSIMEDSITKMVTN